MATTGKKAPAETKSAVASTAGTATKKTTATKSVAAPKIVPKAVAETTVKTVTKTPVAKETVKSVATSKATPVVVEARSAKTPATKKTAPKKKEISVSPEQRYTMIATAAYYLAERRGFEGGSEMDVQDWIAAEAQINAQLTS